MILLLLQEEEGEADEEDMKLCKQTLQLNTGQHVIV